MIQHIMPRLTIHVGFRSKKQSTNRSVKKQGTHFSFCIEEVSSDRLTYSFLFKLYTNNVFTNFELREAPAEDI